MGAGGGSGSDGLGMSTQQPPTPRLSTFLRTFGTSTSTSPDHTTRGYPGVDVVLETRLRERVLRETITGPGAGSSTQSVSCRPGGSGTSTSSGHSSSSSSEKPTLTKHKSVTFEVALLVCTNREDPLEPPKVVKDVLQAYLQSVVQLTGGDTLPTTQLASYALSAFVAMESLVAENTFEYAKQIENCEYATDPALARRKAEVTLRNFKKRELDVLKQQVGRVEAGAFDLFRENVLRLIELRKRQNSSGLAAEKGNRASRASSCDSRFTREYGEDFSFHAPGSSRSARVSQESNYTRLDGDGPTTAASAAAADATRFSLQNASASAREKETTKRSASSGGLFTEPNVTRGTSSHTAQLGWLKQNVTAVAGVGTWEAVATRISSSLLSSPDDKSDDVVAGELFDLLGDSGVDLAMRLVERRGPLCEGACRVFPKSDTPCFTSQLVTVCSYIAIYGQGARLTLCFKNRKRSRNGFWVFAKRWRGGSFGTTARTTATNPPREAAAV